MSYVLITCWLSANTHLILYNFDTCNDSNSILDLRICNLNFSLMIKKLFSYLVVFAKLLQFFLLVL